MRMSENTRTKDAEPITVRATRISCRYVIGKRRKNLTEFQGSEQPYPRRVISLPLMVKYVGHLKWGIKVERSRQQ